MHESEKWKGSRSVVSDSLRPHGLQPTRLLHPWDFPGKSPGVGCHCLVPIGAQLRHLSLWDTSDAVPLSRSFLMGRNWASFIFLFYMRLATNIYWISEQYNFQRISEAYKHLFFLLWRLWDLVPRPGFKLGPFTVRVQSQPLDHQGIPQKHFFKVVNKAIKTLAFSDYLSIYIHKTTQSSNHWRETNKMISLLLVTEFIVDLYFPLSIYYIHYVRATKKG